ncbi:MAG TPA: cytochrome C oxidase subunit IV family protein [Chitinophagaceae bacterium]|nr:cytochrome C oxidase subunit IV family protein [Chitinophagaceae bacterium]
MQHPAFEEVTVHNHHGDDASFRKKVIKTTVILSIITVIELGLGLTMYALHLPDDFRRLLIKGVIIILSLAKAFYIVSIFMHLGDEIRNMIMTIVVPLMLFIWFIVAFIADGNSYKNLRNRFDQHFRETTMPADQHGEKKAADKDIEKTEKSGKD